MTECILAVTLMKWTARSNGHAREEMERILMKDRVKLLALFPNAVLVIPKDDDARFCMTRAEILVFLDVSTHIVGMARGAPFSPRVQYSPNVIC